MAYAEGTSVDSAASRAEIERTLARYGAEQFGYMTSQTAAAVEFVVHERRVRFTVPLPARSEFSTTPTGKARTSKTATENAYEQAVRQRWRALSLLVKAKLESVESGIHTFEQEFFSNVVLPNGGTVYDNVAPAVTRAYETGTVPPILEIGMI